MIVGDDVAIPIDDEAGSQAPLFVIRCLIPGKGPEVVKRVLGIKRIAKKVSKDSTAAFDRFNGTNVDHSGLRLLGQLTETGRNHHGRRLSFRGFFGSDIRFESVDSE